MTKKEAKYFASYIMVRAFTQFFLHTHEIVCYDLVSRKEDIKLYYDGLNQVLTKIKEEQIEEPIILHTNQGSVYSLISYNNLLKEFNIQRSMSRTEISTDNQLMNHLMVGLKKICLSILI